MNPLWYLATFLLAIGILVAVHEFGHYWAARLCGVKVLRFCFGFGKTIWSRRAGADQTEWAIAAFPLGGYVKMLDEREAPVAAVELSRAFNRQTVGRRALIVAAGPLANFLLAVLLYWGLFAHGVDELRPRLAQPPTGTPAAVAGLAAGDEIIAVDGRPVRTWGEFRWEMLRHVLDRTSIDIEVGSAGVTRARHRIDLHAVALGDLESDPLLPVGFRLYRPPVPPVVGEVLAASAAAEAGLQPGDRILMVAGESIDDWYQLAQAARQHPGQALPVVVERDGQTLQLLPVPTVEEERGKPVGRLGVRARPAAEGGAQDRFVQVSYAFPEAFSKALAQTWDTAILSLRMLWRMIVGDLSWKNLSGPVTIADYAGQSASLGTAHYIRFLALVSISLGVLNLLPIPVLDGGHLLYYFVEIIKGAPVSDRVAEIGQQIGLVLLGTLMVFALYNDLSRLLSG